MSTPIPTDLTYRQQARTLELVYEDGTRFELPCEYLRVYSPSAEVKGHGPGQEKLETGKEEVFIMQIKPVGNYAVVLVFSDGHDTGIYTWETLYHLGVNRQRLWHEYLDRLRQQGYARVERSA